MRGIGVDSTIQTFIQLRAVAQIIVKQSNDTLLRGAFDLADVTHEHRPALPNDHPAPGRYDESCLQL